MARTKRMYEPHWLALKANTTIKVELSLSKVPSVLAKLRATITKAIQKEKHLDVNFRSLYPYAKLSTKVTDGGAAILVTLDKGIGTNDDSMEKLFGDTVS